MLALACLPMLAQRRSEAERKNIAQDVLEAQMGEHQHNKQNTNNLKAKEVSERSGLRRLAGSKQILGSQQLLGTELVLSPEEAGDVFSVYGYGDGRPGFVIVSALDDCHPVLAYSTDSRFDADNLSEAARQLLSMYARRAKAHDLTTAMLAQPERSGYSRIGQTVLSGSSQTSVSATAASRRQAPAKAVAPLLGDIAFDQGAPYNGLCPMYNDTRCVVGCVATAMAMVMAYHQHPQRMNTANGSTINYTTKSYGISASWNVASTVFDWQNIQPTYDALLEELRDVSFNTTKNFSFSGLGYNSSDPDWSNYTIIQMLKNIGSSTFNGYVRLFVEDTSGKLLGYASEDDHFTGFGPDYCFNTWYIKPCISSELSDGTYRIFVGTRADGDYLWQRATGADGGPDYVEVEKHGSTFTLAGHNFPCGYTSEQANAVATLCAACAYSLRANFGPSSTGGYTKDACQALVDYMDYSDNLLVARPAYFSTEAWHLYLQDELRASRPIYVEGIPSDPRYAHAFVIDGFQLNTDGVPYYHVNWGWGGSSNAYFLIDYLKPSEVGTGGSEVNYGEEVRVFTNIKPEDGDESSSLIVSTELRVSETDLRENESVTISLYKVTNLSFYNILYASLHAVLTNPWGGAYDLGEITDVLAFSCNFNYIERSQSLTIPSTIPTGDYTLEIRAYDSTLSQYTTVLVPNKVTLHLTTSTDASVGIDEIGQTTNISSAYDLNGRPASTNTRGIVVKEGRKVLK